MQSFHNDKTTDKKNNQTGKYIITPSLYNTVQDFLALYDMSKNYPIKKNPIMIIGNRGVGKSLFIHIFRKLYEMDHKSSQERIKRINVASIPENLIESELFGYKRGAFTGATKDTPGLIGSADLLILEEIGELPKNVQAKLLTFIEDGHYYPVGGRDEIKAINIQIIATTNKKAEDFRPDFFDRFFKFPVPALYQRRTDILYYLYAKVPNLIEKLKPHEIFSILAYHWPGNVRELDHFIHEGYWKMVKNSDKPAKSKPVSFISKYGVNPFFSHYPYAHSSINFFNPLELCASLKNAKINVDLLESILNKYGLGLCSKKIKNGFSIKATIKDLSVEEQAFDKFFDTHTILTYRPYNEGLLRFAALFDQSVDADKDLLNILSTEHNNSSIGITDGTTEPKNDPEAKLRYEIKRFMQSFNQPISELNIFEMTEEALLRYYRQGLIARYGTISAAARHANVKDRTFRSRLK